MTRSYQQFVALGEVSDRGVEVRETERGRQKVAQFQLGTTRRWRDERGESRQKTEWHRVVAWNAPYKGQQLADVAGELLKPGDLVLVSGRVEYRSYADRENPTRKIWVTEIVATELIRATDDRPFEDEDDDTSGGGGNEPGHDDQAGRALSASPYADN